MKLQIKQLKQNSQIIIPRTTAEAVLVKHDNQVKRLDIVLQQKIESVNAPAGSGLKVLMTTPTQAIITHTNEIEPNIEPKPLLLKHDNRGHIVETAPIKPLKVVVDEEVHVDYDGSEEQILQMGDDFTLDENNKIKLNWNNL